jgi:hypothetical protein
MKLRPTRRVLMTGTKIKSWCIIEGLAGKRWLPLVDENGELYKFESPDERDAKMKELELSFKEA